LTYALSSSILGPSLPAIINSLSLDAWRVGAIASAVAIGFFSVLPGGALADRRGKKKLMLAGLFIEMLGYSLVGASLSFEPFLLSLVLFGIGAGFWEVAVSALIPDTFTDSPSGPMNILHSMWGVGGFLGPLLVGLVISASRDWHPSFLVAAALLVAAQMAILLLKESSRQASGSPPLLSAIGSIPKSAVVALALGWGVESGLYMYLPLLLESERGYGTLDASATLGILLLTIAVGRIIWSRLGERMGMANTIRISGIMAGLSVFAAASMAGPLTLPLMLSTGFFISSLAPTILAYIGDRTVASGTGTAIGLTLSAASIGGAVIPASSALIAGWAKLSTAFIFLGMLLMPIFFLMRGSSGAGGHGHRRDVEAEGG